MKKLKDQQFVLMETLMDELNFMAINQEYEAVVLCNIMTKPEEQMLDVFQEYQ